MGKKAGFLMQKVIRHFQKADPILYKALQKTGKIEKIPAREVDDYFTSLCREIINQQLSGKVAHVIFKRFLELFPRQKPTPKYFLKIKGQEVRNIGTSWAKVGFMKDLASKMANQEVQLEKLSKMDNETAITELVKIKGIGRWTAEMFLMFSLGREDVFSQGDLGLKKAMQKLYKIENLTEEKAEEISRKWSPYRTYACRILWDSLK